ncbi:repetitive organellar protein-like [Battus philenor]|uniref:repetitive organellar protein-like n=1 Tax=Battus philenor TaxID=42288 RepID=UPI0035D01F41
MSSSFDESTFNFDLDLLQQNPKNVGIESKIEKLRKDIHLAKKKTIATDSLIRKYFSKSELLEQTEKQLVGAKEECKQVCIEYNTALEKCSKWEKDVQLLSVQNQELQKKLNISDDQYQAIQSHANQLQMLVHQYETQIESLKIESQLEKGSQKEQVKTASAKKPEHDNLLNDICLLRDIVLGKKKVQRCHKAILKKYDKIKSMKSSDDVGNSSSSENDLEEVDTFDCPEILPNDSIDQDKKLSTGCSNISEKKENNENFADKKMDGDHDSDSGNEVISEDTGCGLSSGCSDIEKCFNSPDYFINDSPFSTITQREKKYTVDIATSPITVCNKQVEVATSPIAFLYQNNLCNKTLSKDVGITTNYRDFVTTKSVGTTTARHLYLDKATSPIKIKKIESRFVHKTTSPINFDLIVDALGTENIKSVQEIGTSPVQFHNYVRTIGTNTIQSKQNDKAISPIHFDNVQSTRIFENLTNERECLEINNSSILNDSRTDQEVESILNNMRLDHELITPMPKSPVKPQSSNRVQESCPYTCQDAAKVSEENETLKTSISDLAKEILNIKSLLKSHLLVRDQHINSGPVCNDDVMHASKPLISYCNSVVSCPNVNAPNTLDIVVNNNEINSLEHTSLQSGELRNKPITPCDYVIRSPVLDVSDTFETVTNNNKIKSFQNDRSLLCSKSHNEIENKEQIQDSVHRNDGGDNDTSLQISVKTAEKAMRSLKLTRLEKMRKKLLPKGKIRRVITPTIRKNRKNQLMSKKKTLEENSNSNQNNKLAYENAVKIMAELREKEKNKIKTEPHKNLNKNFKSNHELQVVLSKCDNMIPKEVGQPYQTSPKCKTKYSNDLTVQNNATPINSVTPTNIETAAAIHHTQNSLSAVRTSITTRSRSRRLSSALSYESDASHKGTLEVLLEHEENHVENQVPLSRKRLKRFSSDKSETAAKRILRSSRAPQVVNDKTVNCSIEYNTSNNLDSKSIVNERRSSRTSISQKIEDIKTNSEIFKSTKLVTYNDLDIFSNKCLQKTPCNASSVTSAKAEHPKESIMCRMLEKYGKSSVRCFEKKLPEAKVNSVSKQLEEAIAHILKVPPHETKQAMNAFVNEIKKMNMRIFLAGFMKYLTDPARKDELFNKVSAPPAPQMTKSEQVLLYIIKQLQQSCASGNFVESVLCNIEFALFQLHHTPDFGTVESLSHFYAVVCRFIGAKSRLRLFILDAMYCIQFKSVALIKQCLEVWMPILPLAHMGIAKTPLVTCLVYLLHFFKCEDRFNRVQGIRDILSRKYFYQVTEWTEAKILEMFKNAINDLRDIPIEKKMLRMSLIILAKRRGPHWCQKHIVKNMLQPLIEKEQAPNRVKEFCISVLGPLLKPYPNDMKVHCEIVVNQLLEMLERDITSQMKEAIFTSLLYMRRHNQNRVTQALLSWKPQQISTELENLLKDYVREKPVKVWKNTLSRISVM